MQSTGEEEETERDEYVSGRDGRKSSVAASQLLEKLRQARSMLPRASSALVPMLFRACRTSPSTLTNTMLSFHLAGKQYTTPFYRTSRIICRVAFLMSSVPSPIRTTPLKSCRVLQRLTRKTAVPDNSKNRPLILGRALQ